MNQQQRRAKRAQAYDQKERACDHGIGHPSGPTVWRQPRKPPVTGAAAMLRRLRKQRPELHKLVLAGELTVCAAAIQAGFPRRRQPKPVVVAQIPPMVGGAITSQQEMELWLGPSHHGPAFASEEERRRLWNEHRDRLLRLFGQDGRRPMAWWKYESPVPFPGLRRQRSTLYEHGLLDEAEARALVADWKVEFERASQPDFFFTAGPGEILHGEVARQKHFAWPTSRARWCSNGRPRASAPT